METSIYHFHATTWDGKELNFEQFRGSILLIVNIASRCGFSEQLKELEELYTRYQKDGLVVVGFPCNQFAHQEPGTDSEIEQYCRQNYGVTFQIMHKIDVNGDGAHPLYQYLCKQTKKAFRNQIKWNYTKFLISKDGELIKRFGPTTKPKKMERSIEEYIQ